MDWSNILIATITGGFGFGSGALILRGKKDEQREDRVERLTARVDTLENRLNEEVKLRRIEERFSHLMILDIDVTIRFLEYLQEYLADYADILPGDDSPSVKQVQAVIERLQSAIVRRHGDGDSGHTI